MVHIFHLGLHKTGTTALQKHVFPYVSGGVYVGRPYNSRKCSLIPYHEKILISDETIPGRLIKSYCYKGYSWLSDNLSNFERIRKAHPEAKIILGVREPTSFFLSIYKHYVKYGGSRSLRSFVDMVEEGSYLSWGDMRIAPRVDKLNDLFGGNVFYYYSDNLRRDPLPLIEKMSSFCGVRFDIASSYLPRENSGLGVKGISLARCLNGISIFGKAGNVLDKDRSAKVFRKLGINSYRIAKFLFRNDEAVRVSAAMDGVIKANLEDDWLKARNLIALNTVGR